MASSSRRSSRRAPPSSAMLAVRNRLKRSPFPLRLRLRLGGTIPRPQGSNGALRRPRSLGKLSSDREEGNNAISSSQGFDAYMENLLHRYKLSLGTANPYLPDLSQNNNPEELYIMGNQFYELGNIGFARKAYNRAISLSPGNATYHFKKARARAMLGMNTYVMDKWADGALSCLVEGVCEYERAFLLDGGCQEVRQEAHLELAALYLSLGQVSAASRHLDGIGGIGLLANFLHKTHFDVLCRKKTRLETYILNCGVARAANNWDDLMVNAAIARGVADKSPQVTACLVEAMLKLGKLRGNSDSLLAWFKGCVSLEADSYREGIESEFLGFVPDAYVHYVMARIYLAEGRFGEAYTSAESALKLDDGNAEIRKFLDTLKRPVSEGNYS